MDNKILHIMMGTKGQFVKMAPVMMELERRGVEYNFIHTHQHTVISEKISKVFKLKKPDSYVVKRKKDVVSIKDVFFWYLKCCYNGLFHKKDIWKGKKGICLLHGDTPSTLLGLILAKIAGIKIAHIEAGLRSYNLRHPFPEEIIRRVTTRFADYLFAPSDWAYNNLTKERVKGKSYNTKANTVFESISHILKSNIVIKIPEEPYVVAAVHRNETLYVKQRLKIAIEAIKLAAEKFKIIFVMHTPTKKKLKEHGFYDDIVNNKNIEVHPYFDYFSFIKLVQSAVFVMSDGGGLQEETYFINKPCLILREKTERQYGLGVTACLSEFNMDKIRDFIGNYDKFKRSEDICQIMPSKIIIDNIQKELSLL